MHKRRALTEKEKNEIRARFNNRCPGLPHIKITCGKPLLKNSDCVFDHIEQRVFTGSDDLDEFQPLCAGRGGCNDIKTNGLGGLIRATTAGSDAHKRGKVRRLGKWQKEFEERVLRRECGQKREPTGNWPKVRKIASRKKSSTATATGRKA